MQLPRIVVNAKSYPEATGREAALALARACSEVAAECGIEVALAPPLTELATVGRFLGNGKVRVLAQHVDPALPGAATGWVTAEAVRSAGAVGSLVNHAERKLPADAVAATLKRLAEAGLLSVACTADLDETRRLAALRPTAVAIEPPQLIGGDVSVTDADPHIVRAAVQEARKVAPGVLVLCGAGVKQGSDVARAVELGCHGVLLASGVVKARDPVAALRGLCRGLP